MGLTVAGFTLFALGAPIVVYNVLNSLGLFRDRETGRSASGVPLVGSLALVIAAALLWGWPVWRWTALGLALIDTAGLHVFLLVMLGMHLGFLPGDRRGDADGK